MSRSGSRGQASLSAVITMLAKIAFFADKPQSLPSSTRLVALFGFALFGITLLVGQGDSSGSLINITALQILIYGGMVWLVLRMARKAGRWPQTLLALFGVGCVIRMLSYLPVTFVQAFAQTPEQVIFWSTLIILPFAIWILCASTFIFKEAIETTTGRAFFVAFGIALLTSFIVFALVPINDLTGTELLESERQIHS